MAWGCGPPRALGLAELTPYVKALRLDKVSQGAWVLGTRWEKGAWWGMGSERSYRPTMGDGGTLLLFVYLRGRIETNPFSHLVLKRPQQVWLSQAGAQGREAGIQSGLLTGTQFPETSLQPLGAHPGWKLKPGAGGWGEAQLLGHRPAGVQTLSPPSSGLSLAQ